MVIRVCVVGAGPSGMGTLAMFNKLRDEGEECHVTCYEKQEQPGGLWNLTWRTGLDEYGENVHNSMYCDLFSNGPKECLEFPDYTFNKHFGKPIPSYPPRQVIVDYLRGYWKFHGVTESDVLTRHSVKNVRFDEERGVFSVVVANLAKGEEFEEEFDRVIVATGHFSVPNVPSFKGIESFRGRVMHSHDVRKSSEFAGLRVLLIGSSLSAEDIALQCYKFGAAKITCSYRRAKMGFPWPDKITEVPLLVDVDQGKICHFADGTSGEFDVIILCTGYQHYFPFMSPELRLRTGNVFNLPNLYRGLQWYGVDAGTKDAGGKLFYVGMQNQFYTFTMFMAQSYWITKVVKGLHTPPPRDECVKDIEQKLADVPDLTDPNLIYNLIDGQTVYVQQIAQDVGYGEKLDCSQELKQWVVNKLDNILTFRDMSHKNLSTGEDSPSHPTPWITCFDDSIAGYLGLLN